jgi:peptidyl-prolyl cis-trans isomerase C
MEVFRMGKQAKLAALACLAIAAPLFAGEKPAAIVNGEPIPMADFKAALAIRPPELFPVSAAQRKLQYQEIIELLISEKLMQQFLSKNAPPVSKTDVSRQLAALVESQYSAFMRKNTTDEQLKSYFEANRDFFQKTTVRLSHIVIRLNKSAPEAERAEARSRLSTIRQQIASGKISFADAAKQFSECTSAPRGGDIGFVTRKWTVDENIARVAFAMKKGEISDVVESEFGLHLLLVTERNEGPKVEYAAVADDVRETYTEEMRQKLLLELRKAAKVEVFVK